MEARMNRCKVLHIFLVVAAIMLPQRLWAFTIVIDAGHGGRDKGALGVHSYEKNINLAVALEFGSMIKRNLEGYKSLYPGKFLLCPLREGRRAYRLSSRDHQWLPGGIGARDSL